MSGGVTMVGFYPVVSHQAATIEAAAQELPTDECRQRCLHQNAVTCPAVPVMLLRKHGRCCPGDPGTVRPGTVRPDARWHRLGQTCLPLLKSRDRHSRVQKDNVSDECRWQCTTPRDYLSLTAAS